MRLLAEVGFPVDDPRMPPLHTAAVLGHLDVVRVLVDLGADPLAVAADGGTPNQLVPPGVEPGTATAVDWARYNGQDHVVEYLNALPARRPGPARRAAPPG